MTTYIVHKGLAQCLSILAIFVLLLSFTGKDSAQAIASQSRYPSTADTDHPYQIPNLSIEDGMILHYTFEDGTATDVSGKGNNGVLLGKPEFHPGKLGTGTGLQFDGIDDYIEVPDSPSLDLTGDMTISLWIYQTDATSLGYRFFDKATASSNPNDGYLFDSNGCVLTGRRLRFLASPTPWPIPEQICGKSDYSLNAWHHVVAVKGNGQSRVYLDGNLDGSVSNLTITPTNTLSLRIGAAHPFDSTTLFKGYMDDIRIYNRGLSDAEVQTLYDPCKLNDASRNSIPGTGATTNAKTPQYRYVFPSLNHIKNVQSNPFGDEIPQIISSYNRSFSVAENAYCFANWPIEMQDVLNDLTHFIDLYYPDKTSAYQANSLIFPYAVYEEWGGHCNGMASTAIIYYLHSELSPDPNVPVFKLSKEQARTGIQYYQQLQIAYELEAIMKLHVFDEKIEYENVVHSIGDLSSPIMLNLWDENDHGHTVVAYSIFDLGDDKKGILVYDENDPLDLQGPHIAVFNTLNNTFSYQYFTMYKKFNARQPYLGISDESRLILSDFYEWALKQIQANGMIRITLGSPVNPLISDQMGRKIGVDKGQIVNEVPNAAYTTLGDKWVFDLPEDLNYTLVTTGTGSGTMALSVFLPLPNASVRSVYYFSAPVAPGSLAQVQIKEDNPDWTLINTEGSQQPDANFVTNFNKVWLPIIFKK